MATQLVKLEQNEHGIIFTSKRDLTDQLDCFECEFTISDAQEAERFLPEIGYHPAVVVDKIRRVGSWREWKVCWDIVKGIGAFVEVEAIIGINENPEPHREAMWKFLEGLSVHRSDRVSKGYDRLVAEAEEGNESDQS